MTATDLLNSPQIEDTEAAIVVEVRYTDVEGVPNLGLAKSSTRPEHALLNPSGTLRLAKLGKLANFCKFLAGSFSAVSKRNFARKYSFDSIFQALQGLHPFAPLQSQNFRKKSV